jgi:hypothetical protein
MEFDFTANVLNSSKEALQQGISAMWQLYASPMMFQAGLTNPETLYNMARDFGRYQGQNPEGKYLALPDPDFMKPKILAKDALTTILSGRLPTGTPLEPALEHLQQLQEFLGEPTFAGMLNSRTSEILQEYMRQVQQRAEQEQQQIALAQAAAQSQGGGGGLPLGGPGGTPGAAPPAPLQDNEIADESLQGENVGGGANG